MRPMYKMVEERLNGKMVALPAKRVSIKPAFQPGSFLGGICEARGWGGGCGEDRMLESMPL